MSTTTVLPKLKVSDVPQQAAKAFSAVGVVQKVSTREVSNGYTRVEVALAYTTEQGNDSTFYASWNVRPEYFTPEFIERVKSGEVTGSEKTQFDINFSGLTRGLFAAAGLEDIDFDAVIGSRVGFKTKNRKDDPSRLDISRFFAPKQ